MTDKSTHTLANTVRVGDVIKQDIHYSKDGKLQEIYNDKLRVKKLDSVFGIGMVHITKEWELVGPKMNGAYFSPWVPVYYDDKGDLRLHDQHIDMVEGVKETGDFR